MTIIWVLADDRAGNVSQCLGVADALGLPYIQKNIRYTNAVRLPNVLRGASLLGVDQAQSDALTSPWPDVVIAAGRRLGPVARYIKKHSHAKLVQLMWPGWPAGDFDLIAVPEHDGVSARDNTLPILGAPHRVTPAMLENEAQQWQSHFASLPQPRVALLVGGNTKHHRFTPQHARQLGEEASALAQGGSLLITTSRRTEPDSVQALYQAITCPYYAYDWMQGGANPYFGLLACADKVIVTGDSMSMCSEAVATGKPVYIFAPDAMTSAKHARFHHALFTHSYACRLGADAGVWNGAPYSAAGEIAERIKWLGFV